MGKKVFIVSSTPRSSGNSDILAEEFARGAREAGHSVEKVSLRDIELKFCIGCMRCHERGKCALKDGVNDLLPVIKEADVLVFATPVYYYGMSGQLKTFLDRLNPLYDTDTKFRDVYVLATAAEADESAVDGTVVGVQGWIDCFPGVSIAGVVRGVGAEAVGDVRKTPALAEAYAMGKNI